VGTSAVRFVDRHWPLVLVTFEGTMSDAEFRGFLANMKGYLDRGGRHGYLLDAREGAIMAKPQREEQAHWLKAHDAALRKQVVATAVVLRSAAVRFLLTSIYLIQPPATPTDTFGTRELAFDWLDGLFRREGLRMPARSTVLGP
jgi:hypothetical protein